MQTPTKEHIQTFQQQILTWYAQHQRELPWRKTRDPYAILVSEIMSQQTQINRVVVKYEAWMTELPTIEALAEAPLAQILRLWSGLGYNRRALFLQKTAQSLVKDYHGRWPTTVDDLKKLPGLGPYTASAVACFAFAAQIPVIDTNIRKVMAVEFNQGILPTEKEILVLATAVLPDGQAYVWNQALMDYAASELKQHKIPIPKQSKLFGSDRYYRGQILKMLVAQHSVKKVDLACYFQERGAEIAEERLMSIITGLIKEGLVKEQNGSLFL